MTLEVAKVSTTIAQPIPAPRLATPDWATEHDTHLGLTTYRRPAQTTVVAFPDEVDGDPYPVTVVLDEHHGDGLVEGPVVNVYIPAADVTAAFTIDGARQLQAALAELTGAYDRAVR